MSVDCFWFFILYFVGTWAPSRPRHEHSSYKMQASWDCYPYLVITVSAVVKAHWLWCRHDLFHQNGNLLCWIAFSTMVKIRWVFPLHWKIGFMWNEIFKKWQSPFVTLFFNLFFVSEQYFVVWASERIFTSSFSVLGKLWTLWTRRYTRITWYTTTSIKNL